MKVPENMDDEEEVRELNKMSDQKAIRFELVRIGLIERACKKQERTNLRQKGRSLAWSSMEDHVCSKFLEEVRADEDIALMRSKFLEEIRADEDIALMRTGWRQFIKTL